MTGDNRIARKYATALFDLARSKGVQGDVWHDLDAISKVLDREPRLLRMLASPQMSDTEKKSFVDRTIGAGVTQIVRNFLHFLIDKGRTAPLDNMIRIYRTLLDDSEGAVEATITTAIPLSDEERTRMIGQLERVSGKTVRPTFKVNSSILGGVIAMLGGQILDHSVRHDLIRLRDALRAVKVHQAA